VTESEKKRFVALVRVKGRCLATADSRNRGVAIREAAFRAIERMSSDGDI